MGSCPCNAWTMTLDGVRVVCPEQVQACETAFSAVGYDWDSFAFAMEADAFHDLPDGVDCDEMVDAWESLVDNFKEATLVSDSRLELWIGYYSSEDGDRYDDMEEGCYFGVNGTTMLTPAAEKVKEHLEEKHWTVFG